MEEEIIVPKPLPTPAPVPHIEEEVNKRNDDHSPMPTTEPTPEPV